MAAQFGGTDDAAITDINITPLVDVILVVLIIFMVTATYIVDDSIKITLPQAATGETTEFSSLGLQLTSDGKLYRDGQETTEAQLRAFIKREQAIVGDELTALIAADSEVAHGRVIWLIDLVKQEGVTKFAINIDPAVVEANRRPGG